ncbi:MAG: hypothetical protein RBR19_14750 [Sedimentisphaerales bacterium]|jgi:hypothetical protein|nr:hypothetical protein [Sedimentisphaerales bacterium]NLT75300.1 hypothetical protein [Planctomycetota bacterium]
MFSKLKKDGFLLKTKLFTLRWYPSGRSCIRIGKSRRPPQQMPPLMVRKPEWRR